MAHVFFLARLKRGVDPEAYEKWVREFDYKVGETIPSIISFCTYRVNGILRHADVSYDYIEVLEVTDVEAYRQDMDTLPQAQELFRQIRDYLVRPSQGYWGVPIEAK